MMPVMELDCTPLCPLPNIGPCVGERCNFWDLDAGCLGTGVAFASDPSLNQTDFPETENPE